MTAAGWRAWGGALLAAGAAALAAFAAYEMPVRLPEGSVAADPVGVLLEDPAGEAAHEDLGAFLAGRRWGVFEPEVTEPPPPPPEPPRPPPEPAFEKLGFVGLIVTGDERVVLLRTPGGGIARVAPGAVLPDGRVLVSVSDDRLVLRGEGRHEEVLNLFPPVPPAGDALPPAPSVPTAPSTGDALPPAPAGPAAPTGPVDPAAGLAAPAAPGGEDGRRAGVLAAAGGAVGSPASR